MSPSSTSATATTASPSCRTNARMPRSIQKPLRTAVLLFAFCAAGAAHAAPTPTSLGAFRDWEAFTVTENDGKQCYALAQPDNSLPQNVRRDPIFFMVTNRPSDSVANEPSIKMGYPLKPEQDVSIEIGSSNFRMFTKGDGAWMSTTDEEKDLVGAMRRGSSMVVKGVSTRGTETTDTYSLSGVTAALERAAEACAR